MDKSKIRIFLRWGFRKTAKRPGFWYTDTKSLNDISGEFVKTTIL